MTDSVLVIVTPASTLALLTAAELRAAAGVAVGDTSRDTELAQIGLDAAEWIADLCGIRTAGGNPPTVLAEDLRETFSVGPWRSEIVLARRFVSDVTVTENGSALVDGTDFLVHDDRGMVERLAAAAPVWFSAPLVIEYTAGFGAGSPAYIPAAIRAVATDYVRLRFKGAALDPMVRSETTVDLDSVTYRDAADSQGTFDEAARQRLSRFRASSGFA